MAFNAASTSRLLMPGGPAPRRTAGCPGALNGTWPNKARGSLCRPRYRTLCLLRRPFPRPGTTTARLPRTRGRGTCTAAALNLASTSRLPASPRPPHKKAGRVPRSADTGLTLAKQGTRKPVPPPIPHTLPPAEAFPSPGYHDRPSAPDTLYGRGTCTPGMAFNAASESRLLMPGGPAA